MNDKITLSYIEDKVNWLGMVVPAFNPSTPRQKQAQFKASFDYTMTSRPIRTAYWDSVSKKKKRQSEFISKKKKNVSTINLDISVHTAFQYIDMRCFLHKLREKIKHNIGVNKTRLYQVNLTHKVLKMWDFGQNIFKQTTLKHHTQTSIICQIQTVVHWPMSNRVFPL